MQYWLYIISFVLLVAVELFYIPIARRNGWSTERNRRADGHPVTVIGGGVIFYVAMLIWSIATSFIYKTTDTSANFIVGLTMLAACSFADDLLQLKVWIRLVVQAFATIFLAFQCLPIDSSWLTISVFLFATIGFINGYNFMDGINGITAAYSLTVLGTFLYINSYMHHFASGSMIVLALIAVGIFAFFNFRPRAIVFAGDVGSICMGYIVAFLVVRYVLTVGGLSGITFVIVYGVDTALTIIRRLIEGENIFTPHHKHIYQLLTHVRGIGQLKVASVYALLQLAISIVYLHLPDCHTRYLYLGSVTALLIAAYLIIMFSTRHRKHITHS